MSEFSYDILYLVSEVIDIIFKFSLLILLYQFLEYLNYK